MFSRRTYLHDFLFDLVGSCLSLFNDFRLKIAVSVARNSDFALAIVADYRLFPVTIPTAALCCAASMPHFEGNCANILFAAVTGIIPGYGVLLVA